MPEISKETTQNTNSTQPVHYHDYLGLTPILSAQIPLSGNLPQYDFSKTRTIDDILEDGVASSNVNEPKVMAHEEMFFIIIHQVYELWFKQIIFEIDSVRNILNVNVVQEDQLYTIVARLNRVIEIQKILVQQVGVLETMTPAQFLSFRNSLGTASGFQSFQFRKLELILGLNKENIEMKNRPPATYMDVLTKDQSEQIQSLQIESVKFSILKLVENWLENTPFLSNNGFDFITEYKKIRLNNYQNELSNYPKDSPQYQNIDFQRQMFEKMYDEVEYNKLRDESKVKLSFKARNAALFIMLYSDRPILNLPYQIILQLVQIDELFSTWRYRHSVMVLKMLGRKMGTGGSKGYDYLMETVNANRIFSDFANLSSDLIAVDDLPELTPMIELNLKFLFTFLKGFKPFTN